MEHGDVNIVVKSVKQKVDCKNTFMITMLKLEKMEEFLFGIKVLQKKQMTELEKFQIQKGCEICA
mgnify:CR=1 FL=1